MRYSLPPQIFSPILILPFAPPEPFHPIQGNHWSVFYYRDYFALCRVLCKFNQMVWTLASGFFHWTQSFWDSPILCVDDLIIFIVILYIFYCITIPSLSIHLLKSISGCLQFLVIMYKTSLNSHEKYLHEDRILFLLSKYLGMEWLDHMVSICLTVYKVATLFKVVSFYISITIVWELVSRHLLPNSVWTDILNLTID